MNTTSTTSPGRIPPTSQDRYRPRHARRAPVWLLTNWSAETVRVA